MIDTYLLILQTILIACIALHALKGLLKGDNDTQERNKLINALIAKNAEEHRQLQVVDKLPTIQHELPLEQTNQDLIPVEQMSDEEFDRQIDQLRTLNANN